MISVFTPSHNPRFLDECLASLQAQTYDDWGWTVLLNQGADWSTNDPRVDVYRSSYPPQIGLLKQQAVRFARGQILVELDHDDILLPTALEKVAAAVDNGAEFVYSDSAQINPDGSPNAERYNPAFGWTYRMENGYHVPNAMTLHPHSVSLIWFAPNHLRAFTRDLYNRCGGYSELEVCDDLDLMSKMYLHGTFHHIPELLYLQRVGIDNSQLGPRNALIQTKTRELYDSYIQPLMKKWAAERGLGCYDLGGAFNSPPGYTTIDRHNADIEGDIFDVLGKMEDNSAGIFRAVDFLEHVSDKITLMNELHRVLAHGGMLLSITPSTDGRGAFMDPTHTAFWNENSFWYWTRDSHRQYVPEITARFHSSWLRTYFPSQWHEDNKISYVQANLIALKHPDRFGGQ